MGLVPSWNPFTWLDITKAYRTWRVWVRAYVCVCHQNRCGELPVMLGQPWAPSPKTQRYLCVLWQIWFVCVCEWGPLKIMGSRAQSPPAWVLKSSTSLGALKIGMWYLASSTRSSSSRKSASCMVCRCQCCHEKHHLRSTLCMCSRNRARRSSTVSVSPPWPAATILLTSRCQVSIWHLPSRRKYSHMITCWLNVLDPCHPARQNNLTLAERSRTPDTDFLSVSVVPLPTQLRQGNKRPHKGLLFWFLFLLLFLLGPTPLPLTHAL